MKELVCPHLNHCPIFREYSGESDFNYLRAIVEFKNNSYGCKALEGLRLRDQKEYSSCVVLESLTNQQEILDQLSRVKKRPSGECGPM